MSDDLKGVLYVVATPIGNLGDISKRALSVLEMTDRIVAEDTRVTSKLLRLLGVSHKEIYPLRGHGAVDVATVARWLRDREVVSLVSDAGTPNISDPGRDVVGAALSEGVTPYVIPGPSAVTAILSLCDFRSEKFYFGGFLPNKSAQRVSLLEQLARRSEAIVVFEAPHRIEGTLLDLTATFPHDRRVLVGRELTKLHEQCFYGTVGTVSETVLSAPRKGEFVFAIEGAPEVKDQSLNTTLITLAEELLTRGLGVRTVVDILVKIYGVSKSEFYERCLQIRNSLDG